MSGSAVVVLLGASVGGTPVETALGIGVAMPDPDGYTVNFGVSPVTYRPDSGGSATCEVRYDDTASTVTVVDTGC